MSDFSNNVKENIKRLETSLNVERNFDILQREVIIAGIHLIPQPPWAP